MPRKRTSAMASTVDAENLLNFFLSGEDGGRTKVMAKNTVKKFKNIVSQTYVKYPDGHTWHKVSIYKPSNMSQKEYSDNVYKMIKGLNAVLRRKYPDMFQYGSLGFNSKNAQYDSKTGKLTVTGDLVAEANDFIQYRKMYNDLFMTLDEFMEKHPMPKITVTNANGVQEEVTEYVSLNNGVLNTPFHDELNQHPMKFKKGSRQYREISDFMTQMHDFLDQSFYGYNTINYNSIKKTPMVRKLQPIIEQYMDVAYSANGSFDTDVYRNLFETLRKMLEVK